MEKPELKATDRYPLPMDMEKTESTGNIAQPYPESSRKRKYEEMRCTRLDIEEGTIVVTCGMNEEMYGVSCGSDTDCDDLRQDN